MENKMQSLATIVKEMGITPQEVVQYWTQKGMLSNAFSTELQNVDIRTKAKLYWYFFANGEFSDNAKAYKGCLGVVGWINPDKDALDGDKIYIVLRKQACRVFSLADSEIKANDQYDGLNNTQLILNLSQEQKISFPAVIYCNDMFQLSNGKRAFLPAKEQAIRLAKNGHGIRKALAEIGGNFDGWIWTTSMLVPNNIWVVHTQHAETDVRNRAAKTNTTAIIAL